MRTELINNVTRTIGRVGLGLKKASPEILVVAGTVGVVVSAVMACKVTTKASAITDELKENMEQIHKVREEQPEEKYSEEDMKKDTTIVYTKAAVKYVKLYGPAVALGVVSLACIISSNRILTKRNAALAAAYTGVDTAFKEYRGRVVERFGADTDKELRFNIKAKEIEDMVVDENGNVDFEKKEIKVVEGNNLNGHSDYAKFFDESCYNWSKSPEHNLTYLKMQQNYANEKLQRRGWVSLNEVYEMLGIDRTEAGQVVGWWYDKKNPTYIDFGIYNADNERNRAFVNGYENVILLDFNVMGDILTHI